MAPSPSRSRLSRALRLPKIKFISSFPVAARPFTLHLLLHHHRLLLTTISNLFLNLQQYLGHLATLHNPPLHSQGSLPLPEFHSQTSRTLTCPQPQCLLPSTISPTTWPTPAFKTPLALLKIPFLPVPPKVVGCTLGISLTRPPRGSSKSSSRTTKCECVP